MTIGEEEERRQRRDKNDRYRRRNEQWAEQRREKRIGKKETESKKTDCTHLHETSSTRVK